MKSTIGIKGLHIRCIIGCLEEERMQAQEIEVDIGIERPFPQNDDITQTIDYVEVAQLIERVATFGEFFLLETLAETIARRLYEQYAEIKKVSLSIKKP